MATDTQPAERTAGTITQSLSRWALLIGAGVFSTSFPQAATLRIPFQNLLKSQLGATRVQTASFFAIVASRPVCYG
jgi:hypothetical protein